MPNKKILASAAAALVLAPAAALADQFLCTADRAAGFSYDKVTEEWVSKIFKTDSKWIVRIKKGAATYEVVKMGQEEPTYECVAPGKIDAVIRCEGVGTFVINIKAGRYEARGHEAYVYANFLGGDEKAADVWGEIGRCSAF